MDAVNSLFSLMDGDRDGRVKKEDFLRAYSDTNPEGLGSLLRSLQGGAQASDVNTLKTA